MTPQQLKEIDERLEVNAALLVTAGRERVAIDWLVVDCKALRSEVDRLQKLLSDIAHRHRQNASLPVEARLTLSEEFYGADGQPR